MVIIVFMFVCLCVSTFHLCPSRTLPLWSFCKNKSKERKPDIKDLNTLFTSEYGCLAERKKRLTKLPKVCVKHIPAHAKDRNITSWEGAYFASFRNYLEDEEPNKQPSENSLGMSKVFPLLHLTERSVTLSPPISRCQSCVSGSRRRQGDGGLPCYPDLNSFCLRRMYFKHTYKHVAQRDMRGRTPSKYQNKL